MIYDDCYHWYYSFIFHYLSLSSTIESVGSYIALDVDTNIATLNVVRSNIYSVLRLRLIVFFDIDEFNRLLGRHNVKEWEGGGRDYLRLVLLLVMRRRQTKPFEMANVKFKWDVSYMLATTTAHALFSRETNVYRVRCVRCLTAVAPSVNWL